MEDKRRLTLNWGVLLIVYVAIVFATTMVVLTTGTADVYYVLLLAAGVPIYAFATHTLIREDGSAQALGQNPPLETNVGTNVVSFPERRPTTVAADVARGAAETRAHDDRKAG